MDTWRTEWVKEKQQLALRLNSGECGGSYGEAAIILCSALSALSAEVWPGCKIDRVRFVELLREFAPPSLNVNRISIPLLVGYLRDEGRLTEQDAVRTAFMGVGETLVLIGDRVDKTEDEIRNVINSLTLKELRECSYANLLYTEIRSGYAHQYSPGERADSTAMTSDPRPTVSYGNWLRDPDRHIHFPINWLSDLSLSVAKAVDAASATLPKPVPTAWWVNG